MQCFIGTILPYGGAAVINGFAQTAGQSLPIGQNAALYSVLGTSFGQLNPQSFSLPDLRLRAPLGAITTTAPTQFAVGQVYGQFSQILTPQQLPYHTHVATFAATKATITATATGAVSPQAGPQIAWIPLVPGADPHGLLQPLAGAQYHLTGLSLTDGSGASITGTGPYTTTATTTSTGPQLALSVVPSADYQPATPAMSVTIPGVMSGGTVTLASAGTPPTGTQSPISMMQPSLAVNFLICLSGIYPNT